MIIRQDFKSAEMVLESLLQFASAFNTYDRDWSHLKNKEDFDRVCSMDSSLRLPLENIYSEGRDLALFMSSKLQEFNYPREYPTLKSFVDSFNNGWLYQIDLLKNSSQNAKDTSKAIEQVPWAVSKMIDLYDNQIKLLIAVKHAIESLKETDIYKWEIGQTQQTFPIPEYNKILECVHTVGKMFERLPNTYADKDEESLRDHILVTLQGLISGSTTGESFNKRGKTDILVRDGNDNKFVGECKFWTGEVGYLNTISQLLSYLSLRDTDTAIIMFVPNVNFSAVLDKVAICTSQHPSFLRATSTRDKTWQNFEFRMSEEASTVVNIAVMLYHIPPIN